ncbi:MAG: hypothetical protein LBU00_03965 [Treponema sp.]|jgi:hypothetical protein|nr:hypothetical protein [Treponema sp.]
MSGDTLHNDPITWHTAFRDGIRLTFLPYREVLNFEFEYPLNTEPLRIDAVIIKKQPNVVIDNPLGAIFRAVNIVEYKSPRDSLSVVDYHKVEAYGRLYSVLHKVDITDMTLSFVVEAYPRKLVKYLREVSGYEVEEVVPGIHRVKGGGFGGMQIVETKMLREEDGGLWLRDLRGGLKVEELVRMSSAFEEVMEECGLIAKWKKAGWDDGWDESTKKIARNALAKGMSPDTISEITGLDITAVKKLAQDLTPPVTV